MDKFIFFAQSHDENNTSETCNPQPWSAETIRKVHRLRRLGCDVAFIARSIGIEQHRIERLLSVTQPEITYV